MNIEKYKELRQTAQQYGGRLVAVSKTQPTSAIEQLYKEGQRIFGENKVQEMVAKKAELPPDIEWHLIGHLQTNKVKLVAPFVGMIHSVDSLKLLTEIDHQALKANRTINCLLQIHIADEDTKYGLSFAECEELLNSAQYKAMKNIQICGLMGMATNTENTSMIESEFKALKDFFDLVKQRYFSNAPQFTELSMGMSSDYLIALKNGATLIRIGSTIFGERVY